MYNHARYVIFRHMVGNGTAKYHTTGDTEERHMSGGGAGARMSRQQRERKKRRQFKKRVMHLIEMLILLALILCIRNIYAQLKEIRTTLRLSGVPVYEGRADSEEGETPDQEIRTLDAVDWEISKPVERTEEEVLERLGELAQESDVIRSVYENCAAYPDELLSALANNPEMADFAAGYLEGSADSRSSPGSGLTADECGQAYPLFLQWDTRWGYRPYGTQSCIGLAGCGPTCLSMALFYLTGDDKLTPDRIAEYAMNNGYYVDGTGTAWALMEDVPKLYGIQVTNLSAAAGNLTAILDNGGVIICSVGRGDFTTSGHYIVIYGYDSGGFLVNDPNCIARSARKWTFSELKPQLKNIWAYTKA